MRNRTCAIVIRVRGDNSIFTSPALFCLRKMRNVIGGGLRNDVLE
jgi:hypothetical protein